MENQNFEDYKERFKLMLVRRYNWSVTSASNYDSPALVATFEEGLSPQMSYYKIFEIPEDEQGFQGDGKIGNE